MKKMILLLSLIITIGLVFISCEPDTTTGTRYLSEIKNPYTPNANEKILAEKFIGEDGEKSLIRELLQIDSEENFYFKGKLNSERMIGKISKNGDILWSSNTGFEVKGFAKIEDKQTGNTNLLTVGNYEYGETYSDSAIIKIYDSEGILLTTKHLFQNNRSLVLDDVTVYGENSNFKVVGAIKINDVYYPYIATMQYTNDNDIILINEKILTNLADHRFMNIESVVDDSGYSFYAISYSEIGDKLWRGYNVNLYRVNNNNDIIWRRAIEPENGLRTSISSIHSYRDVIIDEDNIFLALATEDEKDPAPSNGGYWSSCLVTSYTIDGTKNWQQTVSLTNHSEWFASCFVSEDDLYAVGSCAGYSFSGSNNTYGYGLLMEFDKNSGIAKDTLVFGDKLNRSCLYDFLIEDQNIYCTGYTKQEKKDSEYKAWFFSINKDSLATKRSFNNFNISESVETGELCR